MSLGITDTQYYTDIAAAIRSKNGEPATTKYTPAEMATAIEDLPAPTTVEKGLVFSDYDSDGYPHKAEFVGSWTGTTFVFQDLFKIRSNSFAEKITSLTIPEGITNLPANFLLRCTSLTEVNLPSTLTTITGVYNFYGVVAPITIPASFTTFVSNQQFSAYAGTSITFLGNVPNIPNSCFVSAINVMLYDFSNHTGTVPSLYSTASLGHASGCVIKVPQSLLSTWQNSTNWIDLQNVTWQGV